MYESNIDAFGVSQLITTCRVHAYDVLQYIQKYMPIIYMHMYEYMQMFLLLFYMQMMYMQMSMQMYR